jgi:hypothetical protein
MSVSTFSDTFPTPMLLNFWPTDIICNRDAGTDHWMEDVRQDTVCQDKPHRKIK